MKLYWEVGMKKVIRNLIIIVFCVSLVGTLKFSEAPLIYHKIFNLPVLNKMYCILKLLETKDLSRYKSLYDISVGLLGSTIFYFITVEIPYLLDFYYTKDLLGEEVENIRNNMFTIISEILFVYEIDRPLHKLNYKDVMCVDRSMKKPCYIKYNMTEKRLFRKEDTVIKERNPYPRGIQVRLQSVYDKVEELLELQLHNIKDERLSKILYELKRNKFINQYKLEKDNIQGAKIENTQILFSSLRAGDYFYDFIKLYRQLIRLKYNKKVKIQHMSYSKIDEKKIEQLNKEKDEKNKKLKLKIEKLNVSLAYCKEDRNSRCIAEKIDKGIDIDKSGLYVDRKNFNGEYEFEDFGVLKFVKVNKVDRDNKCNVMNKHADIMIIIYPLFHLYFYKIMRTILLQNRMSKTKTIIFVPFTCLLGKKIKNSIIHTCKYESVHFYRTSLRLGFIQLSSNFPNRKSIIDISDEIVEEIDKYEKFNEENNRINSELFEVNDNKVYMKKGKEKNGIEYEEENYLKDIVENLVFYKSLLEEQNKLLMKQNEILTDKSGCIVSVH